MSRFYADRVAFAVSGTPGTGNVTPGSAVGAGYITPSQAGIADGNKPMILFQDGNDFEISECTWVNGSGHFTRDTVRISKAGGTISTSKLNLTSAATCRFVAGAEVFKELHPGIPVLNKTANHTTILGDAQKLLRHPVADNNPRTFTIDSNANVAYPVGTCLTFINEINTLTIAITADTLVMAGSGSTGSRSLAANGIATAVKVDTTRWYISGTGLS